jgi:regulatory protein
MVLHQIQQTLHGVYEITPAAGSAFFLRREYLTQVEPDELEVDIELSDDQSLDIMNAALCYSAEVAAMSYLSRSEHCRSALYTKLLKKQIDKNAVNSALDYLESVGYLSDYRFAGAWLRTRAIDHAEGRIRLSAELFNRGVNRDAVRKALDEFFEENDELDLCRRAYKKCLIFKSEEDKIKASLIAKGFTLKQIQLVMSEGCD